jgi:hypothetical protein
MVHLEAELPLLDAVCPSAWAMFLISSMLNLSLAPSESLAPWSAFQTLLVSFASAMGNGVWSPPSPRRLSMRASRALSLPRMAGQWVRGETPFLTTSRANGPKACMMFVTSESGMRFPPV